MTPSLIKRCDLLGSLVIDQDSSEEIGNIAQLLVNVRTHRVEQIKCTSGFLGHTARYFRWDDVRQIGLDFVSIDGSGKAKPERPESVNSMVGLEIWTESGNKVGLVGDYCLNLMTGCVVDYVFVLNSFQGVAGGAHRLPYTAVINAGHQRMMIMDEVLQSAERFSDGLQDRLTQAFEFIKEEYAHGKADVAALI